MSEPRDCALTLPSPAGRGFRWRFLQWSGKCDCSGNDTRFRPMIRFKPVFAGHGGLYQPEPGRLVLDMGNQTMPGVIDHHHDTALPECTATLIVKQPALVCDHLAGRP